MKTLVTGASSGIGRAVCEKLLEEGRPVLGLARDLAKFPCANPLFSRCEMDLADLDALPERLRHMQRAHPDIEALVCCAGAGRFGDLEQFSWAQIRHLMDLNFTAHAFVARALLPSMKQRGRGDLVFIGSEAALRGAQKGAVYCASKFALRGFAQALREECARSGVRVALINPGMVRSPFFAALDFEPGDEPDNYVLPADVALAVAAALSARPGTVFDEINLSPQKKVVRRKDPP